MKKIKLLLATALLLCSAGAWADDVFKNVTSTYLTNADFEGEYTVYSNPSSNRAIYQPNGWTVSYTNGDSNDMTALNSDCLQWSNFSGKAQLATGGNKTYWIRLRWGTGAILELSQTVTLPEGSYKLSADYYKNGTGGDGYILVNSTEKNASANEDVWKSLSIDFTSDGVAATKIGCKAKHTAEYEKFLAFDNFVLEWNLTEALTSLIASATEAYNEDTSNTTLKSAIDAANDVKDSQDADELETAYNNLKSVAALALNRKAWKEAKDAAESAYDDGDYANITGAEKVALKAEIDKAEPSNAEGYETAKNALIAATSAFTAAKDSYDAYVTAKAAATDVNEADVLAVVIAGNTAATAADALAASVILPKAQTNKDATAAAPVVTDFVVNGTFDSNITGWSRSGDYFQNNQRQTGKPAPFDGGFYENWTPTASNMLNKMYQTISNIPNGTYRLDIAAFVNNLASPNESQYVFANSDKTYLTTSDPTAYEVWTVVTNNSVEIGLEQTTSTANWMAIDNVSLRYYGAGDVVDAAKLANHKLAWDEAKAAAEAAIADAAYANVTGSEKTALQTEIDKAEPTTADGYDAAAEALISATSAFTAAKPAYDAYAEISGVAGDLSVATGDAPTTAAEASTATNNINVAVYAATTASNVFDVTTVYNPSWSSMGTSSGQHWSGDNTLSYADEWRGDTNSSSRNVTVTLPEGSYILMSAGRGSTNTVVTMSANGTTITFASKGDTGYGIETSGAANFSDGTYANENNGRGWEWRYIPVTLSSETDVTVTQTITRLSGNSWASFSDFKILKVGVVATTEDYTALNNAITAAEAKTLGFENSQYAPYKNVAALTALAQAKAIDQNVDNDQDVVQGVKTALNDATWTANTEDVDAIYNGTFSSSEDWGLTGWTRTNNWGQQRNDVDNTSASSNYGYYNQPGSLQYGNQGVYTMPLKANTVYELSFKYASWENNSNTGLTVSVLNGDNGMAAMGFEANGKKYNTEGAFVTKTLVFVTGAAGNYVLTLANGGNTVMTDVSIKKATSQVLEFADGSVPAYAPGTYPTVKITRTLTANRWATAIYPFAVSGVDDIAVLDSYDASTGVIGFATAAASTANQPFLMRSTAGATEITLTNVEVAAANATDATAGKASLKGAYTATNITNDEKNYVLSDNKIYSVGTAGATINPYRAYIQIDQTSEVKALSFFIDGDDATGINAIDNGELTIDNAAIYNLAGQRLNKMQKGINIINGRKVLY